MKTIVLFLFFGVGSGLLCGQGILDKEKLWKSMDERKEEYAQIANRIWDYAELGYLEERSSMELQSKLKAEGFRIEVGVAGMPTAFIATYGEGGATIGILAEYDALPGLSQTTATIPETRDDTDNGHGCGHHLFGAGSVAAAVAVKEYLEKNDIEGTIKVYGTPAEEGGSGKVYMVRDGFFEGVDIVLHWHPDDENGANPYSSLANISAKFRFKGASAHAAGAPWNGRSALDGVEAMNMMVNMMREHMPTDARVHYVITSGGSAPNVVPNFAEVYYYARHPQANEAKALFDRIVNAAEGAALGTDTEMSYEIIGGVYNLLPVPGLSKIMYENMQQVGGVSYTEEEYAYAEELRKSFFFSQLPSISTVERINEWQLGGRSGGSTDVADVSWVVPTAGLRAATWVAGTPSHSWQAVSCGGTAIAHKGMMVAAKTIAATALELFLEPSQIRTIRDEWNQIRGADFEYQALVGDRSPALDYRK